MLPPGKCERSYIRESQSRIYVVLGSLYLLISICLPAYTGWILMRTIRTVALSEIGFWIKYCLTTHWLFHRHSQLVSRCCMFIFCRITFPYCLRKTGMDCMLKIAFKSCNFGMGTGLIWIFHQAILFKRILMIASRTWLVIKSCVFGEQ